MIVFPQMKRLNDHEVTFRVDLESIERNLMHLCLQIGQKHRKRHACFSLCASKLCVVNETARRRRHSLTQNMQDSYLNSLCGLIFTHTSLHRDLISSVLNCYLFIPQILYSKFCFYD